MNMQNNDNSRSPLLIVLIFLIPTLILARGIYDIHVKKTGIATLIPVSKADVPAESEGDSESDCEAEAETESESESEGCP